jgi:pimeloyl-ACP methyl ester carboxylesterase
LLLLVLQQVGLVYAMPFADITTQNKQADVALPRFSELIQQGPHRFHVRRMAPQQPDRQFPVIILLAGPNQNFHADSAWFALLQPLLAQKYQVLAIDRLGNGFSSDAENPSYQRFSKDLVDLLPVLTPQPVIIVSFASASISAHMLYSLQTAAQPITTQVQAMLWIDPDIATPQALTLYQGYPVDWYHKHLPQLLPELAKGVWNERTVQKLMAERSEIDTLLSSAYRGTMDWSYFDAISSQRLFEKRQQQRAIEIANYTEDLNLYAALPAIVDIPVSVIDSDFESAAIQADPAQAKPLQRWQEQGSLWSEAVARRSGGQYISLKNSHHLVMFQHPEKILDAIDWLTQKLTQRSRCQTAASATGDHFSCDTTTPLNK